MALRSRRKKTPLSVRRITWIGVFVSQALMLHGIERLLPVPQLAPGVKLGLANIITLVALSILPWGDAWLILLLRSFLGALLGGGASSVLFSLAGGILSFLIMSALLKYRHIFSTPAISVAGAFCHNLGQILMAGLVVETFNIFVYFPILVVSALVTGFFIGVISDLTVNALKRSRLTPVADDHH
ncbi:MAG: Gx transporter family protein [Firmicutes bacterium]|nr:Gx transporter family protein [Bacillota bacterium]